MRLLYGVLAGMIAPLAFVLALLRGFRDPVYWEHGLERFGWGAYRDGPPCIWLHAVSLGEVSAAAPLVRALRTRHPGIPLLLTTATPTGRSRARALFGAEVETRYVPYDTRGAVARFLRRIRPQLVVILETELWPNVLAACRRRELPVLLVSARMTPRSLSRYLRLKSLFRDALGALALIAAQSQEDAGRFAALGADRSRIAVAGNLKLDVEAGAALIARGAELRQRELGARPVWVAGSTHEGEEEVVLAAHDAVRASVPDALLLLVPRHPQRFQGVADLLVRRGTRFDRRSDGRPVRADAAVMLVDSVGELPAFYAAADVAFVGGSLVPVGGHNLLEPAALGRPVLTGRYNANAADVARALGAAGGAIEVADAAALASRVRALLGDANLRDLLGGRAREFVERHRGSLERLLELMAPWLAPAPAAVPRAHSHPPAPSPVPLPRVPP